MNVTVILVMLIAMTGSIIILQISWLIYQGKKNRSINKELFDIEAALGKRLLPALENQSAASQWVKETKIYSRLAVQLFLIQRLSIVGGQTRDQIAKLYRDLGFHKYDLNRLNSRISIRRVQALRRLLYVALSEDVSKIMEKKGSKHLELLLVAHIVGRVGSTEQLMTVLKEIQVKRRMMEQPIYSLVLRLPEEKIFSLLEQMDVLEQELLIKVILVSAARRVPAFVIPYLQKAAGHISTEVRIASCVAARYMPSESTFELLAVLLNDKDWSVRAQAAKTLQWIPTPLLVDILTEKLSDESFWVRQNAGEALKRCGSVGLEKLTEIYESSSDKYAIDTARQILDGGLRELAKEAS